MLEDLCYEDSCIYTEDEHSMEVNEKSSNSHRIEPFYLNSRAMRWRRKAATNYYRLRGGKGIGRWWDDKIGRVEGAECPKCGEEEQAPDHIVFRCGKVRRVRDKKGRRDCIVLYCICSPRKERLGKGKRNEVGQLGCVGIKEVGENGGVGPC